MKINFAVAIVMAACAVSAQAQTPADKAQDSGWPRSFETGDYSIILHQPQVDEWPNFERITFRAAFSIAKKGQEDRTYGVAFVSAATMVSKTDKLVLITDRKVEKVVFPNVPDADAERLKSVVMAISPPDKAITISLERIIAQMDSSQVMVRPVEVNLAPPVIVASDKPAVMVIFMGKPRFKPVPGSDLMFAVNTNWDVFLDPGSSRYFLLNEKSWLVTENIEKGPWAAAKTLPAALSKLPADDNWSDVRAAIPPVPAKEVPIVYVSNQPAELIVIKGAPEFEPISGTKLMVVSNTDSDLFYHTADKQYYLLTAGRWFKAAAVAGPWSSASASLPEDFKKIPEDSDTADVLASIPGTDAAKEAVIMASIPQKAAVSRADVTVVVTYDGAPQFKPIETTTVQYAYNTPYNVFLVDGKYYCCYNAVWFVSPQPTTAWVVCDSVPKAIYTIPPTSPKYNVTYVTVYESTPTTVVTGYTAGYSGETVAATGVVMFGLGLLVGAALEDDHDDHWGYCYPPYYYSYGCGAHYHGPYGGYACGGAVYGPYGGAGRYAAYNPATGVYSRGAAVYGPNGAAGIRTAYNPSTGNAGYRAGGSNAYGSWGRAGVTNGDDWVRGGYKSGPNGSVGAIQGSGGAGAIKVENKFGNGATVARGQDGDIYAGKDGNVYKKTDDGWEQQSGNRPSTQGANSAQASANRPSTQPTATTRPSGESATTRPSTQPSTTRPTTQPATDRPTTPPSATRPTTQPATTRPATTREAPQQAGNLQKEAAARDRGEQSAARTQQFQRSGGQSASRGGSFQRSGGGGGASRGGRR
jgi:hypothetical protein